MSKPVNSIQEICDRPFSLGYYLLLLEWRLNQGVIRFLCFHCLSVRDFKKNAISITFDLTGINYLKLRHYRQLETGARVKSST